MDLLYKKYRKLKEILRSYGTIAIAYSGGVDSTFLLKTAADVLGGRVLAVTAHAPFVPERELTETKQFCEANSIRQIIVESNALDSDTFRKNPPNRCYYCKQDLFGKMIAEAGKNGISYVAEGSNMDDTGDYRPGMQAIRELGVKSPLQEAELYKYEIRALSRELGLPTWDKPSFACLASRFVYGESITEEKLGMVDRAEQLLLDLGFRQFRVRLHGKLARIEVLPEEIEHLAASETRVGLYAGMKAIGFDYVTMDLGGYRTGSMNETLEGSRVSESGSGINS